MSSAAGSRRRGAVRQRGPIPSSPTADSTFRTRTRCGVTTSNSGPLSPTRQQGRIGLCWRVGLALGGTMILAVGNPILGPEGAVFALLAALFLFLLYWRERSWR